MTSEMPDAFDSSTGLSTTRRATLIDNLFDNWQDLVETLHIPWMGDQHLAIASITAECLRQPSAVDCDMSDDVGRSDEPTSSAADDAAAAADAQQASQELSQSTAGQGTDHCVQCPKCSTGFTSNQPKVNLCIHINSGCLAKSGPFSEADKARLRALDLADCKKCGKWMARRSVNSKRHKQVCKNDRHEAGEAGSEDGDADVPPKPGRYGVYGDSPPQFV
jgi:hypothetical protein